MSVYRAPMDGFVLSMTVVILVLFAGIIGAMLITAATGAGGAVLNVALVAGTVFIMAIAVYAYAYAPTAYRVDDDELRIERPAGDVIVALASISDVTPLDPFLGWSLKALPGGNSGLFGIYGTFYRRDIGKFQMYARRAGKTVLVATRDGAMVVGPERRDEFIARVRRGMGT